MDNDAQPAISRRELLKGIGIAGSAAILPSAVPVSYPPPSGPPASTPSLAHLPRPRRLENLTAEEAEILEAVIGRLIPNDELGPGAVEAGALTYIDRALGGSLAETRESYRDNLAALDRYSRTTRDSPFSRLPATDQDAVLREVEAGSASGAGAGFSGSSAAFFVLVQTHTWQGTFGDPYYGGNAEFVGWDLIRYPGVRTGVSAPDQQRLEAGQLPTVRGSAYDNELFDATAQLHSPQRVQRAQRERG